eukprot:6204666-Pleurochrysis_carterae.AAC.1
MSMQVKSMLETLVLISSHGAQLTNLIWLSEHAAVVEVLLRFGWCCDPVPSKQYASRDPDRPGCDCRAYHKADYANLAQTYGIRYFYVDAEYIDPPYGWNPIFRNRVYIDAEEVAKLAALWVYGFRN